MTAPRLEGIEACVFDAYGTLFDINSAARDAQDALGDKWQPIATVWRTKQLQYTWLRSLAGRHADFWQVTGDALGFALSAHGLNNPELHERLMSLYLALNTYPEAAFALQRLKAAGMRLAILSNGSPAMLEAAVANAGIGNLLATVLSVEEVNVYKPHPSVYRLACERLRLAPQKICFISSNGWDAYSAKAFGMRVLWCNRDHQPEESIPEAPDFQISTLADIPEIVLA